MRRSRLGGGTTGRFMTCRQAYISGTDLMAPHIRKVGAEWRAIQWHLRGVQEQRLREIFLRN